ncbi:MAG: serine hydroxymethyltransferase [Desulfobacterales bacterium]|nr:serine hydroxymethyltransferase [Desulfobacterales bacterium]
MNGLRHDDPELFKLAEQEKKRIAGTLNLIAAENHPPASILEVLGSVFNEKTIEGYPGRRFHAGCVYVDQVESLAIDRAKQLFGAEYANVQPHSGTSANLAVYFSVLSRGDRVLAMSLPHGGHLSHGHTASISSQCFDFRHYTVSRDTERLDYDRIRDMALAFRPKMMVAGASAYPRLIDYKIMADIAKEVSAYLLADMAHLAGLVAGGAIPSPVPFCDAVTFTGYKTMMGGRGGVILAREDLGPKINRAVFPGTQGTSPVSMIAAKALAFKLAKTDGFRRIQQKTVETAGHLAQCLKAAGVCLVTGGTDNHQVLVDLNGTGMTGIRVQESLEAAGILCNRNVVPADTRVEKGAGGIRFGTAGLAARGMGKTQMTAIAGWILRILAAPDDPEGVKEIRAEVRNLCQQFPVAAYGPPE